MFSTSRRSTSSRLTLWAWHRAPRVGRCCRPKQSQCGQVVKCGGHTRHRVPPTVSCSKKLSQIRGRAHSAAPTVLGPHAVQLRPPTSLRGRRVPPGAGGARRSLPHALAAGIRRLKKFAARPPKILRVSTHSVRRAGGLTHLHPLPPAGAVRSLRTTIGSGPPGGRPTAVGCDESRNCTASMGAAPTPRGGARP